MKPGNWAIRKSDIVAFVGTGNTWEKIASVENDRSVRQMLRYAKLGEDVERIADRILGQNLPAKKVKAEVLSLVRACIHDILQRENPINAPEVKP
jgi:hypothetical protein